MELDEAIGIVKCLAHGMDPRTHEKFASDSAYQQADTARALNLALATMEQRRRLSERKRKLPANTGHQWNDAEEQQLCREFDAHVPFWRMAEIHGRTRGGIVARLEKLGKIPPQTDGQELNRKAPERAQPRESAEEYPWFETKR